MEGSGSSYEPTSRRPIAHVFRRTSHLAVKLCRRWGIHPDAVSYASIVVSLGAGLCFWRSGGQPWLLIPAVLLCYARLWMNMLDGMVALARGTASRRGEILNDLPDRVSDILVFVGVAHSGLCDPLLGYWTAIAALLVAYVGVFAQALGTGRAFQGVMSKPWRIVVLHLGAWTALGILWWGDGALTHGGLTVLDWALVVILAGCLQTIVVRLRTILGRLREEGAA